MENNDSRNNIHKGIGIFHLKNIFYEDTIFRTVKMLEKLQNKNNPFKQLFNQKLQNFHHQTMQKPSLGANLDDKYSQRYQ